MMRAFHTRQLESLEASYRELLLSALEKCAAGRLGLFAHNELAAREFSQKLRSRLLDPDGAVEELLDLGSKSSVYVAGLGSKLSRSMSASCR